MQPRVTVALATVWFTVAGLLGETVTLHLFDDQYSPTTPHRYPELQRDQTRDWRARKLAEDQPLDLWIGSRRSISAEELKALRHNAKFGEQDFSLEKPLKDIVSSKRYSLSSWQKRLPNITTTKFAADKVDYGYEMPGTLSREAMVPRSDLLDDRFVADDTFQDQGPGSMEIYKLDLSKEKALLPTATTPSADLPSRNKSKAPKKTSQLNPKTKTTEIKSTTVDPKIHHRQSNFFEEQRTEAPSVNRYAFDVGGVPELQVGCEGLEASPSSHKTKRSIDAPDNKEEGIVPASALLDLMPISLDLDYDPSYDEEDDEEMDELFKLRKFESSTQKVRPNRGDMDARHLYSDRPDGSKLEKLPSRGDLGQSIPQHYRGHETDREKSRKPIDVESKKSAKGKLVSDDGGVIGDRGLARLTEANIEGFSEQIGMGGRKRAKRSANWGFGEDEGVVSSDELQTVNERRRQHDMRYHQDVSGRRDQHRGINPDVDSIRREYENLLEQRRKEEEEERLRRVQQGGGQKTPNRWEEEARRRDEMRKTQYNRNRSRMYYTSTPRTDDEETQRRQMEERQKQEEERRRQMQEEEARRRYNNKGKEETARKWDSKIPMSNEERRQRLHDEETRRREEEEQRRRVQEEEEARRRYNNKGKEENARKWDSKTPMSNEERRQRLHDEETRRKEEEEQRRRVQEEEEARRRYNNKGKEENARKWDSKTSMSNQERKQKLPDEETRRREEERQRQLKKEEDKKREEQYRWQQEAERRKKEEERRKKEERGRDLSEGDRRRLEDRRREWSEKRRQQEEDETRRQQPPSNLMHTGHRINHPNDIRQRDRDEERRAQEEERVRDQKLREYIARNQPINVTHADRRSEEDRRRYRPEEGRDPRRNTSRNEEEELRRRQEEEQKLRDYIRRNQPVNVPSRSDQSGITERNLLEERRLIEDARRRDPVRYPDSGARRHHGPSAPTYNIDRRVSSPEEVRQWQQERERRLQEERRQRYEAEQRQKELAMRQREERERRSREQEAARREEEARKAESRRYEEERKRLEATRLEAERRRQERERSWSRLPEATRTTYYHQDPRLLEEHRRRQDSQPIPSNLVRDEEARRLAAEREKQRLEAERRRLDDSRIKEYRPKETDQWRRQELVRLNSLPVSARIIVVRPGPSSSVSPAVLSRDGFNNEIDFTGINPNRGGIQAPRFPVPPTSRPPARNPGPCVWAIVQCCSPNNNRFVKCFESMGCPGVNWDPNPCRGPLADAARAEVMKFYDNASNQ
ncbi:trichohyalin-like [Nylanderia fulva]|uniref:trichohyalin-like n=1 Tax=Nylanderia fulva TaxID=613905 RepID=UPI0010FAE6A4|nr:trichohyalin-like [Nylanderia fulva]XP_029175555.1 trichohyalin-like [Nylanderia fulva]